MTKALAINVHIEPTTTTAGQIERRHYTVAALIAELQKYEGNTEVVVKDLNTGSFGSIDFRGLSVEAAE